MFEEDEGVLRVGAGVWQGEGVKVRRGVRVKERTGVVHPHNPPQPLHGQPLLLNLCCMLVLNRLSILRFTFRLFMLRATSDVSGWAVGFSTGGGLEGEHGCSDSD